MFVVLQVNVHSPVPLLKQYIFCSLFLAALHLINFGISVFWLPHVRGESPGLSGTVMPGNLPQQWLRLSLQSSHLHRYVAAFALDARAWCCAAGLLESLDFGKPTNASAGPLASGGQPGLMTMQAPVLGLLGAGSGEIHDHLCGSILQTCHVEGDRWDSTIGWPQERHQNPSCLGVRM